MAAVLDQLNTFLWSEYFWLGTQATWEDFTPKEPGIYYPRLRDMLWSIPVAFGLMAVRLVYENILIVPLANAVGLHERKQRHLLPSPPLESAFKKYKGRIPHAEIEKLAAQTDMTERQVERWLFRKRIQLQPSALYKFRECSWHLLFYSFTFVYGMWALWDKSWLWTTANCWVNWPKQHIANDIYWFYLLELGFYWSLLFAIFFSKDYQKKDKNEMVVHHCVTISLIFFSWACNFVRVGTLVLVVHDIADPWMAIAKMAKYSKHQTVCEGFFAVFSVIWIVSRCFVYPLWVLKTSVVEVQDYMTTFPSYWFFNGLLIVLQLLHLMWTYLLLRVAFEKFRSGSDVQDARSESEEEEEESTSENEPKTRTAVGEQSIANGDTTGSTRSRLTHVEK